MTDQQQPRTAAQLAWDDGKRRMPLHWAAEVSMNRAEEVATDLGAQIAELRDTVAAQTTLMNSRYNAQAAMIVRLKDRLAALESPASAPESVKSVFPRTYYVGVEKEPESAPEPDPLCARAGCGHRKSDHQGASGRGVNCIAAIRVVSTEGFGVRSCDCGEFVPQAEPATAHQEPPAAKPAEVILSIYSMCDIRAWDEVGGRMVEIFGDSQPSTTVYIKNDLRDDVANLILGRDGAR